MNAILMGRPGVKPFIDGLIVGHLGPVKGWRVSGHRVQALTVPKMSGGVRWSGLVTQGAELELDPVGQDPPDPFVVALLPALFEQPFFHTPTAASSTS